MTPQIKLPTGLGDDSGMRPITKKKAGEMIEQKFHEYRTELELERLRAVEERREMLAKRRKRAVKTGLAIAGSLLALYKAWVK